MTKTMKLPVRFNIRSVTINGTHRIFSGEALVFGQRVAALPESEGMRSEKAAVAALQSRLRDHAKREARLVALHARPLEDVGCPPIDRFHWEA